MKAKIHVTLKQGILDPQGKAIEHALDSLGFKNAGNVRVGKYMEVDLDEKGAARPSFLLAERARWTGARSMRAVNDSLATSLMRQET